MVAAKNFIQRKNEKYNIINFLHFLRGKKLQAIYEKIKFIDL